MIAIIDYGMGNLRSVQKAFEFLGYTAKITSSIEEIKSAEKVVLPGVGAFQDAMVALRETGLDKVVIEEANSGKPFMGICLGMQILLEKSFEDGEFEGLGLIPGKVIKFDFDDLKIPQIGWNKIMPAEDSRFLNDLPNQMVYFVHSYYCDTEEKYIDAKCNYGIDFAAALRYKNIFATQFHPEKSGDVGLEILRRFASQ